jgi:hypothetical protein
MMARRARASVIAVATVVAGLALPSGTAFASPTALVVPGATAAAVLGHSCGNNREKAYGTGFYGYPLGDVSLSTTCGGKGWSHTYTAWVATVWDLTGALVSYTTLSSAPTVNPTLSVYDTHGNQLYNQSNGAYLVLAPGFVPAPRVAGVSPTSAPQGSNVAITGTSFTGTTAVHFGALAAHFTVNSSTSITAIAPAQRTGAVHVTVTGPGGTSAKTSRDLFTFTLTPRVVSFSPTQGTADGGTSVTITGVNFTGTTAVRFGGVPGTFKVVNDTTIKAVTPPGPDSSVSVNIAVTSPYGTGVAPALFTYT